MVLATWNITLHLKITGPTYLGIDAPENLVHGPSLIREADVVKVEPKSSIDVVLVVVI